MWYLPLWLPHTRISSRSALILILTLTLTLTLIGYHQGQDESQNRLEKEDSLKGLFLETILLHQDRSLTLTLTLTLTPSLRPLIG